MIRLANTCLLAILACALLAPGTAAAQAKADPVRPLRVLILNDGNPTLPAFLAIERGMLSSLTAPGRPEVEVFVESLDLLRYPQRLIDAESAGLLHRKFGATPPDAVVALGEGSLVFAETHAARLWPQARILFMGVNAEALKGRKLGPNTTGMLREVDAIGTVRLALGLQPRLRRLFIVVGAGDFDARLADVARDQLAPLSSRLAIEEWSGLAYDELLRRAATLTPEDAVLYLSVSRDRDGRLFIPRDVVKPLSEASRAPIYGVYETYVGHGVIAGMVYSFENRGRLMGDFVHETLAARPAPPPPVRVSDPETCMADARQLERFGLSERNLPPCDLRFVPHSIWRDYLGYVIGALIVIALQAGLIAALLLQRRGRLRAEKETQSRRAELAQAGRLALAGELTASIAHEINQPLGAILANAGAAEAILKRDPNASEELREILADIQKADQRASDIIRRVRSLVTTREAEREPVDANAMVQEVLTILRGEGERRGVAIQSKGAENLPTLMVDRVQIQQALVNLCLNAMEAMAERAPRRRKLEVSTTAVEGGVEIAVADSGKGIAPEHLPKVFDSFFTTKAQGTGLGLAITRSIVEAHQGRLSAANRDEGGAIFRIVLPAA